jgi:hypothetical protein
LKAILSSGAPDNHCSCPVRDLLPYWAQPTVAPWDRLAHRTLSGAHGQSGAPNRPLERATCRALIGGRLLATGAVGSPDSPVNYSHVAFLFFRERLVDAKPTWGTGHCPVHHRTVRCARPELVLAKLCQLFSNSNLLFLVLFLALR